MYNGLRVIASLLFCASAAAAAGKLPDPTMPLEYRGQKKAVEQLQLHSVLVARGRRLAVINDYQVGEGDRIGDIRVQRILADSVVLYRNGRTWELHLHSRSVRKSLRQ